MKPSTLALPLLALFLAGCASPPWPGDRVVRVYSQPAGAKVILMSADGTAVWTGETPTEMPLHINVSKYKILFQKEGYYQSGFSIDGSIGGWYYGDFATGTPAANAYIEPAIGASWIPLPSKLTWNLMPATIKLPTPDMQALERVDNPY